MKDCAPVKRDGGGGVPPPFPIKIDGGHRKRGTKSVPLLRCRSSLFCGAPLAGWKRWFSIVYITLRPPSTTTHPTLSLHRLYTIRYSMVLPGWAARRLRRQLGRNFQPGRQGLLTFLLSVTRPPAQLCFAAIWPRFWVGQQGLLILLLRVPRSPRCHRFEEVSFWGAIPHLGSAGPCACSLLPRWNSSLCEEWPWPKGPKASP